MVEGSRKGRLSLGWILALILIGLYVGLKLNGWWYGWQVMRFQRQLDGYRPTLSSIALYDQRKKKFEAYAAALDDIRQIDLRGETVLQQLSQTLPHWATIDKLEVRGAGGILIRGFCALAGRDSEAALFSWAENLRDKGYAVGIKEFFPDPQIPTLWHFALKLEKNPNAS